MGTAPSKRRDSTDEILPLLSFALAITRDPKHMDAPNLFRGGKAGTSG